MLYLVFKLLGQFVDVEVPPAKGRADAIVKTDDTIYIFEFKLFDNAETAIAQIKDRGYATPYLMSGKKIVPVAVEFDKEIRNISRWIIEEL